MRKLYTIFILFAALGARGQVITTVAGNGGYNKSSAVAAERPSLHFIENKGQVVDQYGVPRNDIQYKLSSGGVTVFIGAGALHYQFAKNKDLHGEKDKADISKGKGICEFITGKDGNEVECYRMDVVLTGCNKKAEVLAEEGIGYHENYYLPQCPGGLTAHACRKIIYKEIYPHIDWVLYVKGDKLEHEFVVHKGGRVADIQIHYSGATKLSINEDGSLGAATPMGEVREQAPYSYQSDGQPVATSYVLNDDVLSFRTGEYKGELLIDPALIWATYYGGGAIDRLIDCTASTNDHVYVTGYTNSSGNIATVGSFQTAFQGNSDGFLAKFNAEGTIQWATYYGGSNSDVFYSVAIDGDHYVYVGGYTQSNNLATAGSHQLTLAGNYDGIIAKFDDAGTREWATYYGGAQSDYIYGVQSDVAGDVFAVGSSNSTNNISTPGSYQPVFNGGNADAFLAKFSSNGFFYWGTYYGGAATDVAKGVCLNANGSIYICGNTNSNSTIASPGSYKETLTSPFDDGFIVKFNASGFREWATYYGGDSSDACISVLCDDTGYIYVSGNTDRSLTGIATPGSHQDTYGGGDQDAFLVKLDSFGNRLWATYYGGEGHDGFNGYSGKGISIDINGDIYLSGETFSISNIASPNTFLNNIAGTNGNAFLIKFDAQGVRQWGTYFGSDMGEGATGCAASGGDYVYLVGNTASPANIATVGSYQQNYGGMGDGFIAKFKDCDPPTKVTGLAGDTIVCPQSNISYLANPAAGTTSYTWTLPAGWAGSSNTNSMNATAGTGSGLIIIAGVNNCITGQADSLYVQVYPSVIPVITQNGNLLSTGSYQGYQWYLNGQPINGATDSSYSSTQAGHYTVVVTDSNGCTLTSDILPLAVSSLTTGQGIFSVYPNPVQGQLTVAGGSGKMLCITNTIGQVLLQKECTGTKTSIDVSGLPAGLYMVRVGNAVGRFVKE